jgi:predicted NACHT family NTPase
MLEKYNWQRFWCLLGAKVRLSDSGFLFNPGPYNPDIVEFSQIAEMPCLALLGEPGIGKSCTIELETAALQSRFDSTTDRIFVFDLRSFRDEDRLVRSLFNGSEFIQWRNGSYRLHLFLDSLDECLLRLDTVAAILLEELKKYPIDRLFLRIACRTAEWPKLLSTGLREQWGKDRFKLYELLQLRREDVAAAAIAEGVVSDAFLQEIEVRSAGPLAAKPITLSFLLNVFKQYNRFPHTKRALYETGCRILCDEPNVSRIASGLQGKLNPSEKMAIAGRIAAVMMLSNRGSISLGLGSDEAIPEDVASLDFVGWNEETKGQSFQVTEKAVRETLKTGLFTARQEFHLGWAHQTYAEYLTAWYLKHIGLSHKEVLELLTHRNAAQPKLVPQLHETSGWAADLFPKLFEEILQIDPDVLLRSDVGSLNPSYRKKLVAALLKMFEAEELSNDLGLRSQYKYLNHPSLAIQVKPYIVDSSKGWLVRRVAVDIAEECKLGALQDEFLHVLRDKSEDLTMRSQAASAICQIADSKTKAKLKHLAMNGEATDLNQELRGYALIAVWPEHLTSTELFASIVEPRESFFGSYYLFLSNHLVQNLQKEDITSALEWVVRQESNGMSFGLGSVADSIMLLAWEHLDSEGVLETFTQAVWSKITRHQDILGARGFTPSPESIAFFLLDPEKRRRVLLAMLGLVKDPEKDWLWFLRSRAIRVFDFDLEWLIKALPTMAALSRFTAIHILQRFFVAEVKPELLSALVESSIADETLREQLQVLFLVNLDTPEADIARRNFELLEEYHRHEAEEPPLLDPSPSERVEALLTRFENGEIEIWWWLTQELTLGPRSTHYSTSLDADLTTQPGWLAADETIKNRLVAAAKKYIQLGDPKRSDWFGTNQISEPAFAGYKALFLMLLQDPSFLEMLPADLWKKWMPILIGYPRTSGVDEQIEARHRALVTIAYRKAPTVLITDLVSLLEAANAANEHFSISRVYDDCWNEQFGAAILNKAKDTHLKIGLFSHLLDKLLEKDVKGAQHLAASLLQAPVPRSGDKRERAIASARGLMAYSPDAGWSIVWPAMQADRDFGRAVSESLEYILRAGRGTLFSKLKEDNLADYYIWLSTEYPHNEDPSSVGMHMVGPRESVANWRDSILRYLKERGTESSVAAIERIAESLPQLDWMKWVLIDARKRTLTLTWTPRQPAEVLESLINKRATKKPFFHSLFEKSFFTGPLTIFILSVAFVGKAFPVK